MAKGEIPTPFMWKLLHPPSYFWWYNLLLNVLHTSTPEENEREILKSSTSKPFFSPQTYGSHTNSLKNF